MSQQVHCLLIVCHLPCLLGRKEGACRTNSIANFSSWVGEIQHDPAAQVRLQSGAASYKGPCWKFGCCQSKGIKASHAVLHRSLMKTIISETQKICKGNKLKTLGPGQVRG